MKIAFDVDVLAKQMDINRMVHQVADWGYKYIEQSPHPRINPFYKHLLFSKECEQEYRQALCDEDYELMHRLLEDGRKKKEETDGK